MPSESALVVPVPDAEPIVGRWREGLDPSCLWGVPAHITVLYPFVPPDGLDDGVVNGLSDVFADAKGFDFRLQEVRWFGEEVAWIHPEPPEPFAELTGLVASRWPDYPPYQGAFTEVIPHLTISQDGRSPEALDCVRAVASRLPIRTRAEAVWLMTGSPEPTSWRLHTAFPLGE